MGMLKALFGPSRNEIWTQIADSIGGEFIDGGFWSDDALVYRHGEWEVVLDTYTTHTRTGNTSTTHTYTRMRAPFVNRDGLQFSIYRAGLFTSLGKLLGMQDIEIGDSFFDDAFVIKGNDEHKIRQFLQDSRLRQLIQAQPDIQFEIQDDEGFFTKSFPDGVDELYFSCYGVMTDTYRLRNLFELFATALERLVAVDSAYEDAPQVSLR
jgi:hypothetical protein